MVAATTRATIAELLKVRRPKLLAGVLAGIAAISVLATTLVFATASSARATFGDGRPNAVSISVPRLASSSGATVGFTIAAGFAGVLMLVLCIVNVAGEFSNGTIVNLLLAQPRRVAVLAGKALALLVLVAVGIAAAEVVSVATAFVAAPAKGISTTAWLSGAGAGALLSAYGDAAVSALGWAIFGIVVAVLVRSVPLALGAALAWFFPVENVLLRAWSGAARWMPGLLLEGISAGTGGSVSWSRAVVQAACAAVVLAAIATVTFARRDVTT